MCGNVDCLLVRAAQVSTQGHGHELECVSSLLQCRLLPWAPWVSLEASWSSYRRFQRYHVRHSDRHSKGAMYMCAEGPGVRGDEGAHLGGSDAGC